jgi:hypothetical protein
MGVAEWIREAPRVRKIDVEGTTVWGSCHHHQTIEGEASPASKHQLTLHGI